MEYFMRRREDRRKKRSEREKEEKRARKREGLIVGGRGEENPRVLLGDADQESETRMRKNALRTGRRQAVELRKGDLLEVGRELGVEVNGYQTKVEIKDMILQSDKNDMETIKTVMEGILEEKEREYELERLRLSNASKTVRVSSADLEGQEVNRRVNLKDLVPKFDAKNADINLFFEIFERQAIKEKVAEDRWVSQLIPLLPIEIESPKEPLEKSDDYPHIKNLLLARFQLTPIALRDRFESHQRRPGAMWADLVFKLRSYLDNWLAGIKVGDFAALKELLVTEQIKKEHQVN
ncbi:uncharacterized protein TNCV_3165901 [Trichonephila clavipes]|uniref:Uncharacterized protein n=1 Tax=Trichonephila clavipes TaxID=2585209 RepID=A0A8X6REJ5_TRICX|nr:uncharacterized protein TNCV_3165901 [Trichonephila clavipes]